MLVKKVNATLKRIAHSLGRYLKYTPLQPG